MISAREAQKLQTLQTIIQVALRLFAEKGIINTRTLDLAHSAGVSHGTIFSHFRTREALIIKVIYEFGRRVTERMHELAAQGQGVRQVLAAHLQGLAEFEQFYTHLVIEGPLLPPDVRHTLTGIQSAISTHLYEAAEHDIRAGKIRSVAPHLLFNTWLGLLHYYLSNRDLFAPNESVIARKGKELLNHYMSLLKKERRSKS